MKYFYLIGGLLLLTACSSAPERSNPNPGKPSTDEPAALPSKSPNDKNGRDPSPEAQVVHEENQTAPTRTVQSGVILQTEQRQVQQNRIAVYKDTIWDFNRIISEPVVIESGATVRIVAGAHLIFEEGGSLQIGNCQSGSEGRLILEGTPELPIVIENKIPEEELRPLISFECGSQSVVRNIKFQSDKLVFPLVVGEKAHLSEITGLDFSELSQPPYLLPLLGPTEKIGNLRTNAQWIAHDPWVLISGGNVSKLEGRVEGHPIDMVLNPTPLPQHELRLRRAEGTRIISRGTLQTWLNQSPERLPKVTFDPGVEVLLSAGEVLNLSNRHTTFGKEGQHSVKLNAEFESYPWRGLRISGNSSFVTIHNLDLKNASVALDLSMNTLASVSFTSASHISMQASNLVTQGESIVAPGPHHQKAVEFFKIAISEYSKDDIKALIKRTQSPAIRIAAAHHLSQMAKNAESSADELQFFLGIYDQTIDPGFKASFASQVVPQLSSFVVLGTEKMMKTYIQRDSKAGEESALTTRALETIGRDLSNRAYAQTLSPMEAAFLQNGPKFASMMVSWAASKRSAREALDDGRYYVDAAFADRIIERVTGHYASQLNSTELVTTLLNDLRDITRELQNQISQQKRAAVRNTSTDETKTIEANIRNWTVLQAEFISALLHLGRYSSDQKSAPYSAEIINQIADRIRSSVYTYGAGSYALLDQHQEIMGADEISVQRKSYEWGYVKDEEDFVSPHLVRFKNEHSRLAISSYFKVLGGLAQILPKDSSQDMRTRDASDREHLIRVRRQALDTFKSLITPRSSLNPRGDFGIMMMAMESLAMTGPYTEASGAEIRGEFWDFLSKIANNDAQYGGGFRCEHGDCGMWNRTYDQVRKHAELYRQVFVGQSFRSGGGSS